MEKLRIINTQKTYCKYNGAEAIMIKFLQGKKILEQTYNKGSLAYSKLVKISPCNDLEQLIGSEVEVTINTKLNKQGKPWQYVEFL